MLCMSGLLTLLAGLNGRIASLDMSRYVMNSNSRE
jgi:hypothetical protein